MLHPVDHDLSNGAFALHRFIGGFIIHRLCHAFKRAGILRTAFCDLAKASGASQRERALRDQGIAGLRRVAFKQKLCLLSLVDLLKRRDFAGADRNCGLCAVRIGIANDKRQPHTNYGRKSARNGDPAGCSAAAIAPGLGPRGKSIAHVD